MYNAKKKVVVKRPNKIASLKQLQNVKKLFSPRCIPADECRI